MVKPWWTSSLGSYRIVEIKAVRAPTTLGLRRFLQEQPAFRPAVPPDLFMPLADRIRDLGVGVVFPWINLDGLVPPAPAPALAKREPDAVLPAASLTVEEARKVLRATQMEAARPRIRESGAGAVPYADFLRLCCDAARAAWHRRHPETPPFLNDIKPRVLLVMGSSPKPCENPVGDH
ncbi:calcium uniporter protein 3, mitochondrial-like [Zea mays]|uniref:calcium uniporter protein 3, mitochondrial-like n=1 Tax=Zea mays TaxID=4577 RepID=UPI0004DEB9CD|nr:calcium uniporter protein 3, mitochondrial-like [Zea mays]|eukprot:XP_008664259.1 calcium uniporter protein 3, mitochondrial-like [Zea mays]